LARLKHRVKNYNIAVKEWNDQIIFLRKLVPGGTNRSYGIQVAQLAGIPGKVIQRARKVLARVEKHAPGGGDVAEAYVSDAERSKPVQLDLFQSVEREVVDRLRTVDLNTMTPLEALTCLHHLKEKMMNRD
jgi:DNA mismatch repair protein MutS